ncbi:MAG: cold shock domain-containing protein [Calditrichaeota bacterium]|nr:MAG: cold shock domain-containing protein [Calditrichota bacterium]
MQRGVIKMFDHLKGYGFIESEEGDDLYFSKNDLHPKSRNVLLREGLKVGFDVRREMKGDRAVNVRVLST